MSLKREPSLTERIFTPPAVTHDLTRETLAYLEKVAKAHTGTFAQEGEWYAHAAECVRFASEHAEQFRIWQESRK